MSAECSVVLLADRHHGLRDSVRGLLETEFDTVFMVADEASLLEGAGRLRPAIVMLEHVALRRRHGRTARARAHAFARFQGGDAHRARRADGRAGRPWARGADAVVMKRSLSTDLHPALEALREGKQYLSPGIPK
jgi:DNA-binding NarL/FixJ family response regulator